MAMSTFSGSGLKLPSINANFTDTATGTYTDGGVDYKYLTFTGSGTVTFDVAGLADVFIVAGGAAG